MVDHPDLIRAKTAVSSPIAISGIVQSQQFQKRGDNNQKMCDRILSFEFLVRSHRPKISGLTMELTQPVPRLTHQSIAQIY